MKCKICGKRMKNTDEKLCRQCYDFYAWKYDPNGVEQALDDYEVQKNADKKQR